MRKIGYAIFDFDRFYRWNKLYIPKNMLMAAPSWVSDH